MKALMVAAIACMLLCAQGCLRVSQDESGVKADPYAGTTIAPEPPTTAGEQAYQSDASSNGGLGLRAAAPYAGQGTAQQNVNPGPFLTAQTEKQGNAAVTSMGNALIRSADGTMSGPNDLPAASTGWGTEAATYVAPAGSTSRNLPKPKPAASPK